MYLCILKLQNIRLRGKTVPKHSLESMASSAGTRGHTFWTFFSRLLGFLHLSVVSASILVVLLPVGQAVLMMYAVAVSHKRGSVSDGRGSVGQRCRRSASFAFLNRLFSALGQPLALDVGLVPEVGEEDEEEGAVHPDKVDDHRHLVITARHEVILCSMKGHQHKLHLEKDRTWSKQLKVTTMTMSTNDYVLSINYLAVTFLQTQTYCINFLEF